MNDHRDEIEPLIKADGRAAEIERLRRQFFWCPQCESERFPDKIGTARCECGATIETTDPDIELTDTGHEFRF